MEETLDLSFSSFAEREAILRYIDEIIENLPDDALIQLFEGNGQDVDLLLKSLYTETKRTLFSETASTIIPANLQYLDKLTETTIETFRCSNLSYFILDVLPDFIMGEHHIQWSNLVQLYRLLLVLAARDHSKSYFFSFAQVLWHLYRFKKPTATQAISKDLTLSKEVLLFTYEYKLAKVHLAKVREEIENNEILRERLYPEKNKDAWGKEELSTKIGGKMMIRSYGSSARGLHVGRIIVDDFLDESNLYSSVQRTKQIDYLHSVVSNVLLPEGSCTVTGTPFHSNDMYGDLRKRKGWKCFIYPAIFPNGELLWEGRYNLKALLEKRDTQGSIIFSREILCHPVTSDSTIFPYELISRAYNKMDQYKMVKNRLSFPKKFVRVGVGVDFAFSGKVGADYACAVVLGLDDLDNYWLLHIWRGKGLSYSQQMAVLRKINNDFQPDIIGIEANQAQALFGSGGREAGMPFYDDVTGKNKYDLRSGLPGLVLPFEQDKMRWPRGDEASRAATDWLAGEFSSIVWTDNKLEGAGEHDDGVMAYWKAVRALNYIGIGNNLGFV